MNNEIKKTNELKNGSERKNKKKFVVVTAISILTILGGTLAYFTTSTDIANLFNTALYQHKIVEKFVSPDTWTPGTTTPKEVTVTNNGNIDMALRASYTEKWINANGDEIPLSDSEGNIAAIINFNDSWTKDSDGYYYYGNKAYKTILQPGKTSTSFIRSVTFNNNIKASVSETISDDGQTVTYTSTGNGYDNARYILTVKIDTIQYDQASNVW